MEQKSLISLVVPVYKVEQYLDRCVSSLLEQTYESLEILLVDDGSPDRCPAMCDAYAARDPRVRVIHKENGGLSDARNWGLEAARGEYVAFVDSDDYVRPWMMEALLTLGQETQAEIVQCAFLRCGREGTEEPEAEPREPDRVFAETRMEEYLVSHRIKVMTWGKLYRRELFRDLRFPVGKYHEDVFTTYRLLHLARRVAVTQRAGYVYRDNPESIVHEKFSPRRLDGVEGSLAQGEFIQAHYPALAPYANGETLHACNICLLQMGKSNFRDRDTEAALQALYRRYWKDLLSIPASPGSKMLALAARIHLGFAKWVAGKWK